MKYLNVDNQKVYASTNITTFLTIVLLIIITMVFLNAPGVSDMRFWKQWAINADSQGLVAGFDSNQDMYPPFASLILFGSMRIGHFLGIDLEKSIGLSIFLFLILTTFAFWLWTRDLKVTVIFHLSLLLGSVALKLIDIYYAPFLICSLWALKEKKYTIFAILFTISFLIKWQPLIIAPFCALYIFKRGDFVATSYGEDSINVNATDHLRQTNYLKIITRILLPILFILITTFSYYGWTAVWQAFNFALNNIFLSGNALNLNWIITHFLHVFSPNQYGGLINGEASYINISPTDKIAFIPKILFQLTFVITLIIYFRSEKSFQNFIIFSLLGYLSYFTFNIGVHESHLFLVSMLSIIIFWLDRKYSYMMFILVLMNNVNLFLFQGVEGQLGPGFSRVIFNEIDIALIIAIFNVICFLFFWFETVLNTMIKRGHFPASCCGKKVR